MSILHSIIRGEEGEVITVFLDGEVQVAQDDHPNFSAIKERVLDEYDAGEGLADLFDPSISIALEFDRLTDRISVANGRVFLDGDEVDSTLTRHIIRAKNEGSDLAPLVSFFESVSQNPNEHSREQLYDWVKAQGEGLSIDSLGRIVGYKGVTRDSRGRRVSVHSGYAIVDGVEVTGQIPNEIGSVVEMPRSKVAHDPGQSCSTGLHVAVRSYAQGWSQGGGVLEVRVEPRDVVSVPTDAGGEKVRVCRYYISGESVAPRTEAVVYDEYDADEDDYPEDW